LSERALCYTFFMEFPGEQKPFSIKKRAQSFRHAFRGICVFLKTQRNAWVHLCIALVAVVMGIFFSISVTEWLVIILCIGMVISAEAFNTAIEIHMDLTSPDQHPFARDTKDVAAGAVLIISLTAFAIGIAIFLPKIIFLFK